MSRIAVIGEARQELYLIDHDDFDELADQDSAFSGLKSGAEIEIDKACYFVGGSGINAAVELSRFGHEVVYLGRIGRDVAGEAVLKCLDEENVDSSYVELGRGRTGCAVILLDVGSAKRTFLSYAGSAQNLQKLDPEDLESIQPDWLYAGSLQGEMDKLLEFFEKAKRLGCRICFAPGKAELKEKKKLIGLLEDVDILILNRREAAELVPGELLTELLSHLSNYVKTVIITDGEMGAIATNHQETYRLSVYEQSRLRDISGVGDAFSSGYLAASSAGEDFEKSLIFAAANAAKVTQEYGSQTGLLNGTEDLHPMPIMQIDNTEETTNV